MNYISAIVIDSYNGGIIESTYVIDYKLGLVNQGHPEVFHFEMMIS